MKNKRTYSLFAHENNSWTRITPLALFLAGARKTFQGALLSGATRGIKLELRPAEEDFDKADDYKANRVRVFGKETA